MIKILKYALILLIASTQWSCLDLLDKEPYEKYQDKDILNSVEGLNTLLNGAYTIVKDRYYYGALMYQYEASKGYDFFIRDVGGGTSMGSEAGYSLSSTSNGSGASAWQTIYSVITNTNLIIDNVDKLSGDINEIRRVKGEALALRGLAYFDLMRLFAYPPHFSYINPPEPGFKNIVWGVPIIKNSHMSLYPKQYTIRRDSAETVYRYILDHFTTAKAFLDGKSDRQGYINSATVSALRMRVLLYMKQWQDVIIEGEEWLAKYESNYSMITHDNYPYYYYKRFNSESIWELNYTEANSLAASSLNHWVRKPTDDDPTSPYYGQVIKNSGYARVGFMYQYPINGLQFLRFYQDDIRQAWICQLGIQDHPEYLGCRKYVGDPFNSTHNIPMVRLPEIYLSLAEAYFEMSDPSRASEFASKVSLPRRKAAIAAEKIDDVLDERRREYMLEGHTYWDMFRRAKNISSRQYIELSNNGSVSFGSKTAQHYRTVYPIPLREMNANPAIRDQQNVGYTDWVSGGEE